MTVLVAVIRDGRAVVASDRQSTADDVRLVARPKVVRLPVGGSFALLGCSGDVRLARLWATGMHLPDAPDEEDADACDGWADAVSETMLDIARESKLMESDTEPETTGLLVHAGRAWTVGAATADPAHDELPVGTVAVVGCGTPYARGALYALDATIPLAEAARTAVAAASHYDVHCGFGVQVEHSS